MKLNILPHFVLNITNAFAASFDTIIYTVYAFCIAALNPCPLRVTFDPWSYASIFIQKDGHVYANLLSNNHIKYNIHSSSFDFNNVSVSADEINSNTLTQKRRHTFGFCVHVLQK